MGFFGIFKKDKRGFSENERRKMLKEQNYCCVDCGKRINKKTAEADHIIPSSAGGNTERWNGQMLCHKCHVRKSNSERGVYYGKAKDPFKSGNKDTKTKQSSWDIFSTSKPKRKKQNDDDWDIFSTSKPKRKKQNDDDWDIFSTSKPKRKKQNDDDWDIFSTSKPKRKKQNDDDWDIFSTSKPKRKKQNDDDWDIFGSSDSGKKRRRKKTDDDWGFGF